MFVLSLLALLVSCSNENKNSNENKLEECRLACDAKNEDYQDLFCDLLPPTDPCHKTKQLEWMECLKPCQLRYGK